VKVRVLDLLSITAALFVMVVIIYSSSALLDGRFYEEDVQTTWDDIAESFQRWEYSEQARAQESAGEFEFHDPPGMLIVNKISGTLQLEVWDEPYLLAVYEKSAANEDHLDDLYVQADRKNGRIELATHFRPNMPNVTSEVALQVYVPRDLESIAISTISGEVHLDSVPRETDLTVSMVSSDVTVRGGNSLNVRGVNGKIDFLLDGGSVKIDTYSTPVRGSFKELLDDQHVGIKTVSGSIDLLFPEHLDNIEYTVKTESGDINLSPTLAEMRDESSDREVQGVLGVPLHTITLETVSGDITLRLMGDEEPLIDINGLDSIDGIRLFDFIENPQDIELPLDL